MPEHVIIISEDDKPNEALQFFREFSPQTEPLYLIAPTSPDELDSQFQSIRIYLDGNNRRPDGTQGRPLSLDMKTEVENAEEGWKKVRELERKAEEEGQGSKLVDSADLSDVRNKETKAEKKRWEKLLELESQENDIKGLSIHDYLSSFVVPDLNEALINLTTLKPDEPIDYLAMFLEQRLQQGPPN